MPINSHFPLEDTRRSQYAGTWYESDPEKLCMQLNSYLNQAARDLETTAVKQPETTLAIVCPHAGYAYSGRTAAYSYQSARRTKPLRIILLGPSHHIALRGVALPSAVSFETPFGELTVDQEMIGELKAYPIFTMQPEVHRVEHSLELQLPFIKQTFGDVKIVPLVIGQLNDEPEIRLVAEILKGYVQQDDLIVVSSDFTHYGPRYDYQPFNSDIRGNIERLDKEAFKHLSKADVPAWLDFEARTHDTICGFYPCAVLCAMLPSETRAQLLKYSTSQDVVPEDNENSVSYLAIEFTGRSWPENPRKRQSADQTIQLNEHDKATLLRIARRAAETWVREQRVFDPRKEGIEISAPMKECFGAFVTLYKREGHPKEAQRMTPGEHDSSRAKELRGCVGTIWPTRPLWRTVIDNAIASCSRDHRFQPVQSNELSALEIEINVLTPPRRAGSYSDIVLGTDGIVLAKHNRQAVFLPCVPAEFGWTLDETLRELCLKAGLKPDDWREQAKFDLFQSITIEE